MDLAILIDWITDNWKIVVTLFPAVAAAVAYITKRLGKAWPIMVEFVHAIKDKEASDKEIATLVWMLLCTLWGLWSTPSVRILNYMPDHQVAILKAKNFIDASYRPAVKAAHTGG